MIFRRAKRYRALGDNKTITEWLSDPRCRCSKRDTLYSRLERMGWSAEEAIVTPVRGRRMRAKETT